MPFPSQEPSGDRDISLWKVVSLAQQRHIACRGAGVSESVPQVERGDMTAFAEALERPNRFAAAGGIDRDDGRIDLLEEPIEHVRRIGD